MSDFSNILGGLNIPSQIPLDIKSYSENELILSDLGVSFNLAYTYFKGLKVFCFEEQTTWEWREVLPGQENTGLIENDFTYPANIITFGINYSNKTYNFFKVETPLVSTFVEEGDNITITGDGTENDPYVFTGLLPPFNIANNSYFPRNRNESQFGDIGTYSYDFSDALIGANNDTDGQTSQNGVHPQELYGALGNYTFTKGYNVSAQGIGDSIFGKYNHSTTQSNYSFLTGKNNYNNSKYNFLSGSFNQINNNTLGNSAVFGQGNYVFGSAGLTAGAALINKSFGTTVLGQANLDYTNTSDTVNDLTTPLFIIGNGTVVTSSGRWSTSSRSDALKLLKNGLLTLPSVTNALITADVTGKAAISKEYLESVLPSISDGSETKLEAGANINITGLGTTDVPYIISSTNDDITQYTDEFAQQAIGSILENNNEITFTYDNLTPSINANLSEDYTTSLNFRFEEIESLLNRNSYIINVGTYEKTSTTNLQINPDWNWKIDRILYANVITQNITIPLCENGFNRIDLVVLNQLNTAELILGEETVGTAISPTVPPNKLQAFLINVGDTDFEEEIPLLTNQVSQDVRVGVTETAPSEQAVIDYVSEQTTILDNSKADRSFITGASKAKITYNNEGIVIAGADLTESDIPTLGQAKITGLTTDLALKAPLASPTFTGTPSAPTATAGTNTTQIATTAFATAALAGKMNTPSLTANLIPKALTSSTIGNSRIQDTGTYLGVGTVNTPTKDITLGNQLNREIGVEVSDSTSLGKNLSINAGNTINYSTSNDFNDLSQFVASTYTGVAYAQNGNLYATVNNGGNGGLYVMTGSTGNFTYQSSQLKGIQKLAINKNNDVYVINASIIYKMTNATGSFVDLGQTARSWSFLSSNYDSFNVYATAGDNNIYKQTNGTGDFIALTGITSRNYNLVYEHPNGNLYATVSGTNDVFVQYGGTGDFIALGQTLRGYTAGGILNNGNVYLSSGGSVFVQYTGTGNFTQITVTPRTYLSFSGNTLGNVYTNTISAVYLQSNYAAGTPDLNGGTLKLQAGTGKGTGTSDIELYTGAKLSSGTDMQPLTLKAKINNEGVMTLPSVTNVLIAADSTGKAVVTKEFVEAKQIQRLAQYTVATLPTGVQGDTAYVTDALTPVYLMPVVGGGAVVCKVFFNGTNWIT